MDLPEEWPQVWARYLEQTIDRKVSGKEWRMSPPSREREAGSRLSPATVPGAQQVTGMESENV